MGKARIRGKMAGGFVVAASAALIVVPGTAGATTFTNFTPINIPDANDATPSTVQASGLSGTVSKVRVGISGADTVNPQDIDLLLAGPGGQATFVISDTCVGGMFNNSSFSFDDAAATTMAGLCPPGTYKPTNADLLDDGFAPATGAPAPTAAASLSVFNGTNPNGTWTLFAKDDDAGATAEISAWSIDIETAVPGPTGQRARALKKCAKIKKNKKKKKRCKKRARKLPV